MYNIILESKNFFRMRRRRDKNVIELRIQFFLLLVYSIYVSVQHRESNNTGGGGGEHPHTLYKMLCNSCRN